MRLFSRDRDYEAFEEVMQEALKRMPMRLLDYCLMPNHWHMMLWPREDGDLSKFMFWLTMTHVQRWRHARGVVGLGPLYQGRFRAFPVETDEHYLTVCRYVPSARSRSGCWGPRSPGRLSASGGPRWTPGTPPPDRQQFLDLPVQGAVLDRDRAVLLGPLGEP